VANDAAADLRFLAIRKKITAACDLSGRDPNQIVLVGAAKRQPIASIRAALNLGLKVLGENRVQEAIEKQAVLEQDIDWHLIGPLQSNKAKRAVELFSTIHSVDRLKIARTLDHHAMLQGKSLQVFVEVNLADEETKHGFTPSTLIHDLQPVAALENIRVLGLMAIPPFDADAEASRSWFRKLRLLRDELCNQPEWQGCPGNLSMGMSSDFEVAIQEGATHVRIGSALFGPRDR
jgi:pyridoxal phosphate enzyme (YggS family)